MSDGSSSNSSPPVSPFERVSPQTLRAWDNAHVWHPFAPMTAFRNENVPVIASGEGFDLIDVEGHRYLDGISSLWCNVHGHNVPEINQALHQQIDTIAHSTLLGLAGEPSIRLARALIERAPSGLTKVFYSDSGATSVEVALKMAYQYFRQRRHQPEERDLFICVGNAYHGDTIGSVSVGGIDLFHRCYKHLLFETLTVPSPSAFHAPQGWTPEGWLQHCFDETERCIRENAHRAAGFVMEPLVQGAAGILIHPHGFLKHVRNLCTQYGIPLIADEVAVGFGRTGTMFACEQEQVSPDLLCLAKGISGGYLPLAATLATDEIFDEFLGEPIEGRTFYHGHTYTGNAMGCAAGLASLELMDRHEVLANVSRNASLLQQRLDEIRQHPHVADVRQKGVMVGIELMQDRDRLEPFEASRRTGHLVTLAARQRGVIIRPLGDVVVLMPAPAMPSHLVSHLCDIVFESINQATTSN